MKRFAFLAAVVCACAPLVSIAHTNPARRSVAVQTEKNAVVLLVTWTVPSGEYGEAYTAEATWGRRGADARKALEATLAAKAVGPLRVTLDGAALAPAMSVKLIEDPPRSGRLAAAVLLTAPVTSKGPHTVTVGIAPGADMTRALVFDRSGGLAASEWPVEGDFLTGAHSLSIRWP